MSRAAPHRSASRPVRCGRRETRSDRGGAARCPSASSGAPRRRRSTARAEPARPPGPRRARRCAGGARGRPRRAARARQTVRGRATGRRPPAGSERPRPRGCQGGRAGGSSHGPRPAGTAARSTALPRIGGAIANPTGPSFPPMRASIAYDVPPADSPAGSRRRLRRRAGRPRPHQDIRGPLAYNGGSGSASREISLQGGAPA